MDSCRAARLGFAKVQGNWCLAAKLKPNLAKVLAAPDAQAFNDPIGLLQAPRKVRMGALQLLPTLVEALGKQANDGQVPDFDKAGKSREDSLQLCQYRHCVKQTFRRQIGPPGLLIYTLCSNQKRGTQLLESKWRRRSDSNRCMEVLQTSPLTTWVRRPRAESQSRPDPINYHAQESASIEDRRSAASQ